MATKYLDYAGLQALVAQIKAGDKVSTDALDSLSTRVGANETAIATLNGTGAGSVSKAVADLRKEIMEGEGVDPDVVESFKELQDYITVHGSEAATMAGNITALQTGKQDVISDLATIRSNASTGAGLKSKVDGIASGAQVNVIESVKLKTGSAAATALTVSSKSVTIDVSGKADVGHTHTAANITDFATAVAAVKTTNSDHATTADSATTAGSCTGNAATATKATKDGDGNVISSTYVKSADITSITKAEIDALFAA